MVITSTPLRISFFGGGTDYPVWYRQYGGAVLATTINKCCYITCRRLPPFFDIVELSLHLSRETSIHNLREVLIHYFVNRFA